MKPCYINSVGCVSTQNTLDNSKFLDEIAVYDANVIEIIKPNYKDYMQGASARRMAKGVKMGVVASTIALKEAELESPDAIITGSGMGCLLDSEKFLRNIIDNDEEFLTPTSFIQSTHNTVGAQVALGLKCKAYNFTYVHSATSFESSLVDAQLMLDEGNAANILVGGIDELAGHTVAIHKLIDHVKTKEDINSLQVLDSGTKGSVFGEGATFFVLSDAKSDTTYASLQAVETYFNISVENVEDKLVSFLKNNDLTINDIDAVVLGNNGDVDYDTYYKNLQDGILKDVQQVAYKHLSGEFNTASAFGFWVASKILKTQTIPTELKLNTKEKENYKNVLLYNQYRGENHSFILIQAC